MVFLVIVYISIMLSTGSNNLALASLVQLVSPFHCTHDTDASKVGGVLLVAHIPLSSHPAPTFSIQFNSNWQAYVITEASPRFRSGTYILIYAPMATTFPHLYPEVILGA